MSARAVLGTAAITGMAFAAVHGHALALLSPGASTASANERLGMRMAADAGWSPGQRQCLNWLWTRESGWRLIWNYEGSGAYGIPQALPASKMASAGPDYMTSAATQVRWGLRYIRSTYGSPCRAWSHELTFSWY